MNAPEFANRPWQIAGLKSWDEFIVDDTRDNFFVMACPGAGKTRFAIAAIKAAIAAAEVDIVVLVAPSEKIRDQWVKDANSLIKFDFHHPTSQTLKDSMLDEDIGMNGIAVTYQKMAVNSDVFEHWCRERKVMVIFDEVHHLCDQRAWGNNAEIGFRNAHMRLILSGTPFRTNTSERIPFIMEQNGEGNIAVRQPDVSYSYGQAAEDKVCRTAYFHRIDATIQYEDNDGTWAHKLSEKGLTDQTYGRVYRAALDTKKSGYPRYLFETAYEHLKRIRKTEQSDAAMLIIARDQDHAKDLQVIVHAVIGVKPPIVISEDQRSKDTLDKFVKQKTPVLVSVRMVGEGVDIPRVRMIAFLSREKTEMWFRQVVGRAVRWQDHVADPQNAHIYIPQLPYFEEMALRIEEEISHVYVQPPVPPGPGPDVPGPGGGGGGPPVFDVHGSVDHARNGYIGIGEEFSESEAEEAEEIADSSPLLRRIGPETVAAVMRGINQMKKSKRYEDFDLGDEL